MSTNLPGEDGGSFPIAPSTVGGATSTRPGSLQITQTSFSACRAQYPGGLDQVHLLVSSLPMQPPRLLAGSASTVELSEPREPCTFNQRRRRDCWWRLAGAPC